MPHEEPTIEQTATAQDPVAQHAPPLADESEPAFAGEERWPDQPDAGELPARPRRHLFSSPLPLALLGVLLIACGFIGGVLVEKGQGSSSAITGTGASGLASRFAALRAAAGGAAGSASTSAASTGSSTTGASGAGAGPSGLASAFGARGSSAGATVGQVAYLDGSTLYVTGTEGNTVKVTTAPGASVTKTVKADVKGIHPGETVVVAGTPGANGAISAESIRVGTTGAGGGLGALFGGSGGSGSRGGGAGTGTGSASGGGGGEPALFGSSK